MRTALACSVAIVLLAATAGSGAAISVVGSLSQQTTMQPGATCEGTIAVRNQSDAVQVARVYQADYECHADGRCLFGEPGRAPRSNANWIALPTRRLELAPQATATVPYTIAVPADTKLQGTYWSVIMIEAASEPLAPPAAGAKAAVGMQQVLRYGVQVVTDIGATGAPNLQLSGEHVVKTDRGQTQPQGRAFTVDAANTGDRSLLPLAWLELFDASGKSAGRFTAEPLRIYPGCSVRFQFDLTAAPAGKYRGLLVLDNRDESVFGAQYELDVQ